MQRLTTTPPASSPETLDRPATASARLAALDGDRARDPVEVLVDPRRRLGVEIRRIREPPGEAVLGITVKRSSADTLPDRS